MSTDTNGLATLRAACLNCIDQAATVDPDGVLSLLGRTLVLELKRPGDLERLHQELVRMAPDTATARAAETRAVIGG